ncbi:YozQ family protein [Ornithinibacillus scapharcae]|uniref:YozQ family protein n=1 Tax=Ornithinibacillus scapharcae TaxID=1147159 RepID=UPI000225B7F5|nr:YozQ family protein [Ornithinibacillus scapharcae]
MAKDKQEQKNSNEVAEKYYDVSGYQSNNQTEKGLAITHEQATDAYTEGTIEAKIDQLDEQGELKSHNGEDINQ